MCRSMFAKMFYGEFLFLNSPFSVALFFYTYIYEWEQKRSGIFKARVAGSRIE